ESELGDVLDYLALQLSARAILVHLEGIADARRFMSAARAAARMKPVLVLKAGRQLGQPAARRQGFGLRLHRDQVYDAAFARAGLVRVGSMEELFAAAASLGAGAARRGHGLRKGRLALLTNGHGPGEFAADALVAGGGQLVAPGARLLGAIAGAVGEVASLASSVDLGPDADAVAYGAALAVLLETPEVDGIIVIHGRSAGIDPAAVAAEVAAVTDRKKPRGTQRPVLAAWLGGTAADMARPTFEGAAIPAFTTPEAAVRAFLYRVQHERRQFLLHQVPASRGYGREAAVDAVSRTIAVASRENRQALSECEGMALLDAYGIASVPTRLAPDLDAAAAAAAELGYPVALKIVSPRLVQKSSVGGVALDIIDDASLMRRGRHMLNQVRAAVPDAAIDGFLVQRMERSLRPIELYLGVEIDPTFGPVLLLGHAALRASATAIVYLLPPLDSALAHAMVDETPLGRFLSQQGQDGAILEGVVEALVRLSELVVEQPSIRRLAIDPLLVSAGRQVVLDAHVELVRPGAEGRSPLAVRPYPRELEQTATLRDGRPIRLRPIRPDDAPRLQQLFGSLTPEDRRRRLFSSVSGLSDELAARMTQIDYDREMVLVALDPEDPEQLWGGARIAADADNRRAEYSVTIRSDKQGLGLGRICFERVLDYARARGLEEIWGTVLAENDGMLGLAQHLGFTRRRDPDSPELIITEKRLV
ncbi:MAG: GNAT family N-acetyltransferase, partial [Geminicoccaceae bacterium]